MSAPLPLRVCCMAVMAPALTETAPQARMKLTPVSNSLLTPSKPILNGKTEASKENLRNKVNHTKGSFVKKHFPVSIISQKTNVKNSEGPVIKSKIGAYKTVSPFIKSQTVPTTVNQIKLIKGSTQIGISQRQADSSEQTRVPEIPKGPVVFSKREKSGSSSFSVGNTMSDSSFGFLGSLKKMGMYSKSEDLQTDALSPPSHSLGASRSNGESTTDVNIECTVPTSDQDVKDEMDLSTMSTEITDKLGRLNQRTDCLMRRLRHLQGKKYTRHVRQQIVGYLSQQQNVSASNKLECATSLSDLRAGLLQSEDMKNLSTAALVSLVRKLQSNQSVSLSRQLLGGKSEKTSVCMDADTKAECNTISGRLLNSFHNIESGFDSDATECSSGGESCDESDATSDSEVLVPIHRRAEWKWSGDRGAIVSRWTWLQAQVSDLEYRIRQHSDIYKQIRGSKGNVTLGDPPQVQIKMQNSEVEASPCNISSVLSNVNHQASKLTRSLGNCLSPLQSSTLSSLGTSCKSASDPSHTVNGVIGANHAGGDASVSNCSSPSANISCSSNSQTPEMTCASDATCQSVRCRPVKSFRKRKLLRTLGVHQVGRKAARLSSVKCQCCPPDWCSMCGGRYNNSQILEPEVMSYTEKVSLLDSGFHPVLSFNEEVPLSIHLESLMKSGDWQNKAPSKSIRASLADRRKLRALPSLLTNAQSKRLQKSATLLSSEKIRIKYENKKSLSKSPYHEGRVTQRGRLKAGTYVRKNELKKRKAAKLALASLKKRNGRSLSFSSSKLNQSFTDSVLANSASSSSLKELKDAALRKRRESAYDINNIVIPYSMASATRLEKIQYKEIVTPEWRDLDSEESYGDPTSKSHVPTDEELQDCQEEAHTLRHAFCEAEEKKRFASFHTSQQARRARTSRGDSATSEQYSPDALQIDQSFSNIPLNTHFLEPPRRRTTSFNTLLDMSDFTEAMPVAEPWLLRSFPLTEDIYSDMLKIQPPPEDPDTTETVKFELDVPRSPQIVTTINSAPASPSVISSSASSTCPFDDANDPDWDVERR